MGPTHIQMHYTRRSYASGMGPTHIGMLPGWDQPILECFRDGTNTYWNASGMGPTHIGMLPAWGVCVKEISPAKPRTKQSTARSNRYNNAHGAARLFACNAFKDPVKRRWSRRTRLTPSASSHLRSQKLWKSGKVTRATLRKSNLS